MTTTDIRGGGVSAYIHNDLKHNLIESTYQDGNNYLRVHVEKFAIHVGVAYNPGDTDLEKFLNAYDSQLQERKRAIVFGDYNIDLLTKNKTLKKYKQRIHESGHKILNKVNQTYCTRDSSTKKSILDHVSTNLNNVQYNFAIINSSFSDLKQIYLQLNKWKPQKLRLKYETTDYNKLFFTIESHGLENVSNNYEELETKLKQYIKENKISRAKLMNPHYCWRQLKKPPMVAT